jgi:hypothetical protein
MFATPELTPKDPPTPDENAKNPKEEPARKNPVTEPKNQTKDVSIPKTTINKTKNSQEIDNKEDNQSTNASSNSDEDFFNTPHDKDIVPNK